MSCAFRSSWYDGLTYSKPSLSCVRGAGHSIAANTSSVAAPAISPMIGATVAQMADGDAQRFATSLAAFTTTAFA
jgi:hypothetical protein